MSGKRKDTKRKGATAEAPIMVLDVDESKLFTPYHDEDRFLFDHFTAGLVEPGQGVPHVKLPMLKVIAGCHGVMIAQAKREE